uniref:Signal sequence receptor subunit 2 n=1 Tax=Gallus gallus TaxID=9031 RepID=A0A8V1AFG5_CHICK
MLFCSFAQNLSLLRVHFLCVWFPFLQLLSVLPPSFCSLLVTHQPHPPCFSLCPFCFKSQFSQQLTHPCGTAIPSVSAGPSCDSLLIPVISFPVAFSAALDVELSDDSFPPEDFGIVSGMLNVKWDRIAPASNVSHTVVLRPLKAGYFNFTSATITYLAQEGGQVVVGFTSAPGQGGILAQREFDRRFSPHFLDWAAFGVMTLPSIGIPLLLWYSSKRKYDTPKTKKN